MIIIISLALHFVFGHDCMLIILLVCLLSTQAEGEAAGGAGQGAQGGGGGVGGGGGGVPVQQEPALADRVSILQPRVKSFLLLPSENNLCIYFSW